MNLPFSTIFVLLIGISCSSASNRNVPRHQLRRHPHQSLSQHHITSRSGKAGSLRYSNPGNLDTGALTNLPKAADDNVSTAMGTPVDIHAINNDVDPNNSASSLIISSFTQPENGKVEQLFWNFGPFRYTPNSNFVGNDSFKYTIQDGSGNSSTAIVTISVFLMDTAKEK